MGEAQVKEALKIARNDTSVAVELLFNPELMVRAAEAQQHGAQGSRAGPMAGGLALPEGAAVGQLTEEHVMQMMEQEPQVFQQLLQSLTQRQPEIAMLAQQDPQALITILTQIMNQAMSQGVLGGVGGDAPAAQGAPQGGVQVPVTEEEKEAIEGLKGMFPHVPEIAIIQTFKACGSDAAMAAT